MIAKEDMKKEFDVMTEKEYAVFLNDAVRGKYFRESCIHCDDFKTCEKTADRLDDCRMQTEADYQAQEICLVNVKEVEDAFGEKQDMDYEEDADDAGAESSVEKEK